MDALRNFDLGAHRPLIESIGLGALAIPAVHHLLSKDSDNTDRVMSGIELGGLGLLAAPELQHLLGH